jgi:hypothetical protein
MGSVVSYGGVWGLVSVVGVHVCPAITPGMYGVELGFGIVKLGVVCVYPYPNMLDVVCCGIQKVGSKSSMVVWL